MNGRSGLRAIVPSGRPQPEVADGVHGLPGAKGVGQVEQGILALAEADGVQLRQVAQGLLRLHRRVGAAGDDERRPGLHLAQHTLHVMELGIDQLDADDVGPVLVHDPAQRRRDRTGRTWSAGASRGRAA